MAPSLVPRKLLQVLRRADVLRRPDAFELAVERDQAVKGSDAVLDTFHNGLQVFIAALGEVVEVDTGRVTGIGGREVDGASGVPAVGFQDKPRPDATVGGGVLSVAWEVSVKVGRNAAEEQVVVVAGY